MFAWSFPKAYNLPSSCKVEQVAVNSQRDTTVFVCEDALHLWRFSEVNACLLKHRTSYTHYCVHTPGRVPAHHPALHAESAVHDHHPSSGCTHAGQAETIC